MYILSQYICKNEIITLLDDTSLCRLSKNRQNSLSPPMYILINIYTLLHIHASYLIMRARACVYAMPS